MTSPPSPERDEGETQSQQRRRFRRARPSLPPRRPELTSVLPHDRGDRFEPNADGAALIDKGTLGGNAPDDILAILPPP